MPRMKILNAVEQEAFESPPVFNSVRRKAYFGLPVSLTPPRSESACTHSSARLLAELGLL